MQVWIATIDDGIDKVFVNNQGPDGVEEEGTAESKANIWFANIRATTWDRTRISYDEGGAMSFMGSRDGREAPVWFRVFPREAE